MADRPGRDLLGANPTEADHGVDLVGEGVEGSGVSNPDSFGMRVRGTGAE